jgi:hypothetical protein
MEADPSPDDASRKENAWKRSLLLFLLLFLLLTGWWYFSGDDLSEAYSQGAGQKTGIAGTASETAAKSGSRFDRPRLQQRGPNGSGVGGDAPPAGLERPGRSAGSSGSGTERPMVALQEMAVVKSELLVKTFGREQLTNQILEEAVKSVSERHGVRFVFSSDAVSTGNVLIFQSTRGVADLTGDIESLLLTRYGLKPQQKDGPKSEERRALTKTGK